MHTTIAVFMLTTFFTSAQAADISESIAQEPFVAIFIQIAVPAHDLEPGTYWIMKDGDDYITSMLIGNDSRNGPVLSRNQYLNLCEMLMPELTNPKGKWPYPDPEPDGASFLRFILGNDGHDRLFMLDDTPMSLYTVAGHISGLRPLNGDSD